MKATEQYFAVDRFMESMNEILWPVIQSSLRFN